ncbi:MAG: GAF domain-containing protein [Caldimonas sp.]
MSEQEGVALLTDSDLEEGLAAVAHPDARDRVLRLIDRIASQRMAAIVFSASTCRAEALEVTRIYSSRADIYPVGETTNKRETSWGRHVLRDRRIFVGEGSLAMAAAFDDPAGMARSGMQSIINVPIVVKDRCLGVLNFGFGTDRIDWRQLSVARSLAILSIVAFL